MAEDQSPWHLPWTTPAEENPVPPTDPKPDGAAMADRGRISDKVTGQFNQTDTGEGGLACHCSMLHGSLGTRPVGGTACPLARLRDAKTVTVGWAAAALLALECWPVRLDLEDSC